MFADAEAYERFMGRWSRLVAEQMVAKAALPERGRVLDVGSGTGALAFAVATGRTGLEVVGIDPSGEYVGYANSRNRFGERVRFEEGDAQKLRFADGEFEGAASLLVFNFIPDARKALAEVRRVTQAGGEVAAAVWDYGDGMEMLRVFWDAAVSVDAGAEKRDEKWMPLCRAGELAALWREGGLEEVTEGAIEIRMRFGSFADYWDPFLLGQGPAGAYVKGLSGEKVKELREAVKKRLGVREEGKGFTLRGKAWHVRGSVRE